MKILAVNHCKSVCTIFELAYLKILLVQAIVARPNGYKNAHILKTPPTPISLLKTHVSCFKQSSRLGEKLPQLAILKYFFFEIQLPINILWVGITFAPVFVVRVLARKVLI